MSRSNFVYTEMHTIIILIVSVECYVVTANCSVEVLAFSAYGSSCMPRAGHIKLDGVAVWRSSWCGNFPLLRGVNTMLINPFDCSAQDIRHFDTHVSTNGATQLKDYLQLVNRGSVIVGVSADEPRENLGNALSTLRQFGIEVADLTRRGSFGFIAQKGFLAKTVLRKVLTEAESNSNPPHFNAIITGIQRAVRARQFIIAVNLIILL